MTETNYRRYSGGAFFAEMMMAQFGGMAVMLSISMLIPMPGIVAAMLVWLMPVPSYFLLRYLLKVVPMSDKNRTTNVRRNWLLIGLSLGFVVGLALGFVLHMTPTFT